MTANKTIDLARSVAVDGDRGAYVAPLLLHRGHPRTNMGMVRPMTG